MGSFFVFGVERDVYATDDGAGAPFLEAGTDAGEHVIGPGEVVPIRVSLLRQAAIASVFTAWRLMTLFARRTAKAGA